MASPRSSDAPGLVALSRRPVGFIGHYVGRHANAHAVVLLSVVAGTACSVGSQYAGRTLIDALSRGQSGPIWFAFAVLAGLVAADNMIWRLGGWIASHCFVAVTGALRSDLFRHLTGHSPAYFSDRMPGMLASRISATGNAVYTVENTVTWNVLPPLLAVLFAFVAMMTVSPLMAGVLLLLSVLLSWVMAVLARRGKPLHDTYATTAARVDGELVDVINNMPLVRAFGATFRERERFSQRLAGEMEARGRSLRYLEKLRLIHAAVTALLTAALLAWAIVLFQAHRATIGDVAMVIALGFTILHGTRDLAVALVDTVQHVARLSEALATLLLPHDMLDAEDAHALDAPRGTVEFRSVTYGYVAGSHPVLSELTLRIEAGQRVGLVGRSGSGKSTALALLQRLRDVQQGRILIDGMDIAGLTQESLRDAIGVVPQDVSLFHRSVLANIRYGRPDASDEEVRAAAAAAGCRGFIEHLPEGLQTMVGDRGAKLSGGQRQRIAIARAFLRNAPILLLDEATSALDSESEMVVQRALDRLMQGRTVIAVAHRLATLQDFDRVIVMESGRVVQDGSPAQLERSRGLYRELLSLQAMQVASAAD